MAVICSCILLKAVVSEASESAMEARVGGGAGGVVWTSGSDTPDVGTTEEGTPVDGVTVADASPDVAMKSDTRLLRRALLRRK